MELLKRLTQTDAPSGNEGAVRELIIGEIKPYADEITVDVLGNVIARKRGAGKKLMLTAHMDEVGMIATSLGEGRQVKFSVLGDVKACALQYRKIKFLSSEVGIVGKIAENSEKCYADLLACKGVTLDSEFIGRPAVFVSEFDRNGDFITAKALDGRAGCYALIETLRHLPATDNDLYFVFTTQSELGQRGAKTAANLVMPDYAITVDCAETGVKLGEGPAIKVMDRSVICHPLVKELLARGAEGAPVQYLVEEKEKSDAGAIHLSGAAAGVLSIPIKYRHTACETVSADDLHGTVKILTYACEVPL
ncbi:aminopeptidase [Clostridia bacterium]|nr:aminopeptidase [Clostridia bacterium]